jgi:phosphoribosylglycinamide formyltransferase-1
MATLELGVLVSGSGTNLQAILDAVRERKLDAHVRTVISNKPDAFALERAKRAAIPTRVVSHQDYESREAFDTALVAALRDAGAEWIVLAGFMRLLTPVFLRAFPGRIVNIHPALLPAFPGVHAQQQALLYGVKVTGCTVHFVDEGVDTGPVIAQRALAVREDDDLETLTARLLVEEHAAMVEALRWISEGRVEIVPAPEGGRPSVRVNSK